MKNNISEFKKNIKKKNDEILKSIHYGLYLYLYIIFITRKF